MKIVLQDVTVTFPRAKERLTALSGFSIYAEKGEFVTLCGSSGCGKSTVLRLIMGMVSPDEGKVITEGRLSFMPTDDMLLPWRTVLSNAVIAAEFAAEDKRAARGRAGDLLKVFGLSGFGDALPHQLSGGMRQRAALLRAFMHGGDFWLLDEPFGRLDAITKEKMQHWLKGVAKSMGVGVLMVTHDIDEAVYLSDRLYVLSDSPGKVKDELSLKGLDKDSRESGAMSGARQAVRFALTEGRETEGEYTYI